MSLIQRAIDISPEAIHLKVVDKLLDYWALGCILYELLFGATPFPRDIRDPIYEEMISMSMQSDPELPTLLNFPEKGRKFSLQVKDIMIRLLDPRPKDRLGAWHGSEDIKCHPWFKDVPRWKAIEDCQVAAPYLPDAICEEPEDRTRYDLSSDDFASDARGPEAAEYQERLCFVG